MNMRCFIFGISLTLYFAQNVSRINIYINVRSYIAFSIQNGNVIKFTNLICESFNKTWFTFNECRLRAVNRNKTVININATVHYPANDVHVDAQVFKKANGYKPWLIKISLDGCRFIKKAYNPVAIIIFKMFREFSNLNHSCPYVVSGNEAINIITINAFSHLYREHN